MSAPRAAARKCSFPRDTLNPVLCSIAIQGPQNSMRTPRVMTRKPPNTLRCAMTRKLRIMAQTARGHHAQATAHASAVATSHAEHDGKP